MYQMQLQKDRSMNEHMHAKQMRVPTGISLSCEHGMNPTSSLRLKSRQRLIADLFCCCCPSCSSTFRIWQP